MDMSTAGPSYEFKVSPEARLLRITLRGQWTLAHVERYDRDRTACLVETGWRSGTFNCLIDLRGTGVQSQEVAAAQSKALAQMPIAPRQFAVLIESMLAKHQANRVSDHLRRRFFADESEALAWLSAGA